MKIALIGYGKMGQTIEEVALQRRHQVVLKINEDNLAEFTKQNIRYRYRIHRSGKRV